MAEGTRVAVVSGSNKGIGLSIVRGLCKQFDGDVYLTARDVGRGQAAVAELEKEGLKPKFHQLDITDHNSVEELKKFLEDKYGGLDILVNNAAIAFKGSSKAPFTEQAETSIAVNFTALMDVCRTLFPLLRKHARVVHLSSFVAIRTLGKCSADLQQKLKSCTKLPEVEAFMAKFVKDVKDGTFKANGFPESAYGMSKVGVTMVTPLQQEHLNTHPTKTDLDIIVNCADPGWVQTDMSSQSGPLTPAEGADTPLYLALLPANVKEPRGQHVSVRKVVEWQ